jgi:hypothetical protein
MRSALICRVIATFRCGNAAPRSRGLPPGKGLKDVTCLRREYRHRAGAIASREWKYPVEGVAVRRSAGIDGAHPVDAPGVKPMGLPVRETPFRLRHRQVHRQALRAIPHDQERRVILVHEIASGNAGFARTRSFLHWQARGGSHSRGHHQIEHFRWYAPHQNHGVPPARDRRRLGCF